jgi:hypothetical protein
MQRNEKTRQVVVVVVVSDRESLIDVVNWTPRCGTTFLEVVEQQHVVFRS